MNRERKLSAVSRVLGDPKLVKGDEHVFTCVDPFRRHSESSKTKLKLSVNIETDVFNCWSCGFKGKSLAGILRLVRNNPDLEEYLDEAGGPPRCVRVEVQEPPKLPPEMKTLAHMGQRDKLESKYLEYLLKRGVGIQDVFRYKLGFCSSGGYSGRVVIPSFDKNGNLSTFAARSIYGGVEPKYDGPEVDKTTIVFNELMVDWDRDVVIVEGQMDAIVGGDNFIPLCGKTLPVRSVLFKRLVAAGRTAYVALDPDAVDQAIRICSDLAAYDVRAMLVPMDGTDPADAGRREMKERIAKAVPIDDRIDVIRAKLEALS